MRETAGSTVVISNHWHKPAVTVTVRYHEHSAPAGSIAMEMRLEDLLLAVQHEMEQHHPVKHLTRARRAKALDEAMSRAIEKVKGASSVAIVAVTKAMREVDE
jgi:hypothetical protein